MKQLRRLITDSPAHWVGDGFPVRSLISYHEHGAEISPYLLLDYAEPYEFPPAERPRGVGRHPHRGFETVTIVYQGKLAHRDSAGHSGVIGPGDVQWMTAASGIIHEEFHDQEFTRRGGMFEVVQLWVNLPAQYKMSPPKYQTLLARDIPVVSLAEDRGHVRVVAGEFRGARGVAKTFTPVDLWDVRVPAGASVTLPGRDGHMAAILLVRGELRVNGSARIQAGSLALFERDGSGLDVHAGEESSLLFLGGEPIDEPIAGRGPFVMNTQEEIQQAVRDFQTGRMERID
ncbi:MAG: pirin family protein [Planctomycetes bacterium]|nr:pirin family protein [Planctomycetota bacterium]